ncbi:Hsp20/alpha crystallin family protein [Candidatus Protofrankia californiensis]|uniref:Hsp20/alpha crystallin family protein n=1 Tax=Candidatus Protofrankia californiensis TaxID=1839754 RepID=UPI001041197D|nr:Hsp20/alpha crystallin family protein [Candidatus Protofrankia californiensis]
MTVPSVLSRPGPLTRRAWDPFAEFGDLYERMGRLLDVSLPELAARERRSWTPAVDVEETENSYLIDADLPGVPAQAVSIDVRGNEVTITAEIADRQRSGVMRQQTRRVGRYEYSVRLPGDVDAESSEARLSDGVLQLRLPKVSATSSRHVPVIEAGGSEAGKQARSATTSGDGSGSRSATS